MTSFQIDPSFTGYGKTGVRLLKIRRSGKYHGIKQIEVSTELKLNNYDDYFRGDNASIVPTDTQKNTVYALAKQHQASKFIYFTVQPFYVFRALSVTRTNSLDFENNDLRNILAVSIKHGLRTAVHGLRTGYKIWTRYKMRTPD